MKVFLSGSNASISFMSKCSGWRLAGALRAEPSNAEQARKPGKESRMTCTSANTQLDSLLSPRDERSATWAFPHCDLAPFGDSESCTHVHIPHNNTPESLQTACPIHTLFSQPSIGFTFVRHWQMIFMFLAISHFHIGTGFSSAGWSYFLDREL